MSEDSDLLVFGNPQYMKVIYKFNFDNNEGELLEFNKILTNKKFEGFAHKMFRMMCILSGCDYLPSVNKKGMHKAYHLVKEHKSVAKVIEVITSKGSEVPINFLQSFTRSTNSFLYQSVYDPLTCDIRHLNELPDCVDQTFSHDFEANISKADLFDFITGNISPRTGAKQNHFDLKKTIPVNTYLIALFRARPDLFQPDQVSLIATLPTDTAGQDVRPKPTQSSTSSACAVASGDTRLYTATFKVLGTQHHLQMQNNLEEAYVTYHDAGLPVKACLTSEPDNDKDSSALLVQLDYGKGLKPAGYIAKEMTQFLHPLLTSNAPVTVAVKHIKFGTLRSQIGYYMALNVTNQGLWDKVVQAAS